MRILLTNDDGIYSEGIQALRKRLEEEHDIYLFAPDRERSATGHAITLHHPLRAEEIKFRDSKARCWAINGTPSDCVKLGIEGILRELPDLVISGINKGPNLGNDVIYSGTVSAALEGMIMGIPAFAVSLVAHDDWDFSYAVEFTAQMVEWFKKQNLKKPTLLNINIPSLPREELNGVVITKLGKRTYKNSFERRIDPRGRVYYWLAGEVVDDLEEEGTDLLAIKNNQISITPISLNFTDYEMLEELKKMKLDF
ncbi:5'/3'-nucleotidase SurE [Anoxybacter fermentans]|uniref:5'-nucleotidase SurE n=1 Tax=Anoxybacter fermentans TaxID=1323375 RepID=A0A3Q9HQM8_9FIRM|nr:5'/3'-nucleotidase SurE [Anoxybacter fermentans]AZR72445.1 5'/3'-nucleotidase SurE [Anoxybacter fermentans]